MNNMYTTQAKIFFPDGGKDQYIEGQNCKNISVDGDKLIIHISDTVEEIYSGIPFKITNIRTYGK